MLEGGNSKNEGDLTAMEIDSNECPDEQSHLSKTS